MYQYMFLYYVIRLYFSINVPVIYVSLSVNAYCITNLCLIE